MSRDSAGWQPVDLDALERQMDDNLEATGTEDVFVEASIQHALIAELRAARRVMEAAQDVVEDGGPGAPHEYVIDYLAAALADYDRLTK